MNQFFSEAERHLTSAHNSSLILQRVARSVVPALADFCLIFVEQDDVVSCIAAAHATPEGERLLRRLNRVYKVTRNDPVSTVASVLRSGRPRLRTEISSESMAPFRSLPVFTLYRRLAPCSALVVPIGTTPNVRGAVSLCFAQSGRHYSSHDIPAARRLASLIATFLRHRARESRAPLHLAIAARRTVRLRARV